MYMYMCIYIHLSARNLVHILRFFSVKKHRGIYGTEHADAGHKDKNCHTVSAITILNNVT